jgi:DisA bacterial checkpoint controller nucleotide-binding
MVLRSNSRLREVLGENGLEFLEHSLGAFQRILPHVKISEWVQIPWRKSESVWVNSSRKKIRITIPIGSPDNPASRSLTATVERRSVTVASQAAGRTLDAREFNICKRISTRISEVLEGAPAEISGATIRAVHDAFDEDVVAQHIETHYKIRMSVTTLFADLHALSEQSYENKALAFGCIIDVDAHEEGEYAKFPRQFLVAKKYKALSDGFRTAYRVSGGGQLLEFVDLEMFEDRDLTGHNYYPIWAERVARSSRDRRYGIVLSRQGDMLVFDGGSLRFTYRNGRWQYWNHNHILNLLRDRAKAQKVSSKTINAVIVAIYLGALDVSFRRSGGLFVILHNRRNLRQIVRFGDAIGDSSRSLADKDFDSVLQGEKIQNIDPVTLVELAALDGAIVVRNDGAILAYGAVLSPKNAGRLRGTEGSRTKAAIGASNYGLAIKISSDGDIDVYHQGKSFIRVS